MGEETEPMTPKEKVDAYITLYTQQMDRFSKTQDVEWKGNLGLWTLLGGAIYLVASAKQPIVIQRPGLILGAVVLAHLLWLVNVHKSERYDKELWDEYRTSALRLIEGTVSAQHELTRFRKILRRMKMLVSEAFWLLAEAGMTGILCWGLFALLHSQKCPQVAG